MDDHKRQIVTLSVSVSDLICASVCLFGYYTSSKFVGVGKSPAILMIALVKFALGAFAYSFLAFSSILIMLKGLEWKKYTVSP